VLPEAFANPAAKEVLRYRKALRVGFEQVRAGGWPTANHIIQVQGELERNNAGFRKLPGTALKDGGGQTGADDRDHPRHQGCLVRLQASIRGYKFYSQDWINNLFMHPRIAASCASRRSAAATTTSTLR
jgi:hypothetical protein